jgi:predicted amidohydrolase
LITGIAQIDIIWNNMPKNMKKIEELVMEASQNNVELILFPEMALTGFTMNINKLILSEEEILKWISHIAVDNNINIGLGFAIKVDEKGKNKYVIVSKEGNILALYTKIHPFSYSGEDGKYYKGSEIFNCEIKEFQITPFICYDLRFPEIFQAASKKSQVITVAASWPKAREEHWITLLKARAIENQCYIIGINRIGLGDGIEYGGKSIFVNPDGKILNQMNSKEMLIIEDLKMTAIEEVKYRFDIKKDRREDLYFIRGLSKGASINDK